MGDHWFSHDEGSAAEQHRGCVGTDTTSPAGWSRSLAESSAEKEGENTPEARSAGAVWAQMCLSIWPLSSLDCPQALQETQSCCPTTKSPQTYLDGMSIHRSPRLLWPVGGGVGGMMGNGQKQPGSIRRAFASSLNLLLFMLTRPPWAGTHTHLISLTFRKMT